VRPQLVIVYGNSGQSPYRFLFNEFAADTEKAYPSGHGDWVCRSFVVPGRFRVVGVPHMSRYDISAHSAVAAWYQAVAETTPLPTEMKSSGLPALAAPDARVLILGTLPGAVSLASGQYYAQPRNVFWRIMGELVGASLELPYSKRVERLVARRIAVWDVCAVAERQGSAEVDIQSETIRPNDFVTFSRTHPDIELICFNGAKAAALFQRHVLPTLESPANTIRQVVLPSTSPANAAMLFERKLSEWRAALQDR
jgi:double-stranded uracil-DNA glycosylase